MKRLQKLAPVILFLAFIPACIHKTGSTAVTPWERVHTYNAALAEANNAIEQGAEAVALSNLATPAEVAPIINASGQVALVHQQITAILAQGQATQANIASVAALVDTIKASIQKIPPAALGLKNPKSQRVFQDDVNNIYTLLDAVLTALQAVAPASNGRYDPIPPTPYAGGGA